MVVSGRLRATFGRGHRPGFHSPIILCDRIRPWWPSLRTPRPSVQRERYAMGTLEPIALSPRDATQFLSISKRTMSRLISSRKIAARKDGKRTLVDVASLKAYYASLPLKKRSCAAYIRPSGHG